MVKIFHYNDLILYGQTNKLESLEKSLMNIRSDKWFLPCKQSYPGANCIVFTYKGDEGFCNSFRLWLKLDYKHFRFQVLNIIGSWKAELADYEYNEYLEKFNNDIIKQVIQDDIIKKNKAET